MFNRLFGFLTEKGENHIFVRSGGIEWELLMSSLSIKKMPDIGKKVSVYTFLYHKEDQMKIFSFSDSHERSLFLNLIKINGIGPKQAMKILSNINAEYFTELIDSGNSKELSRIPGLGLKTSQKIILALKGKINFTEKNTNDEHDDIVNALSDMGFDRKKAHNAVTSIHSEIIRNNNFDKEKLEKEIFRQAIILLSS